MQLLKHVGTSNIVMESSISICFENRDEEMDKKGLTKKNSQYGKTSLPVCLNLTICYLTLKLNISYWVKYPKNGILDHDG